MDELHFVTSQLERLRLLGDRYRESVAEAAAAKDYFEQNRIGFDNARVLAVERMKLDRSWGEFCWQYPLALKGADEIWMSPEEREAWWQHAKTAAETWNDAKGLGHSLGALANLNSDLNRLNQAHQLYEERLLLAKRERQTLAIIKTLLNLGNSHLRQNELGQARQRLHEARCAAITHDVPLEEARALGNLAVTTDRLGRTMVAVRMLRRRLLVLDRCEDPTQRGSTHGNLGLYLSELGRFDEAEFHLRCSLTLHVEAKNFVREAFALAAISNLHEAKGDLESAILIMEKARDIFRDASQKKLATDCEEEIDRLNRIG